MIQSVVHPYLENALLHNSVGQDVLEKALKGTAKFQPRFQHGMLRLFQEMPKNDAIGYARFIRVMTCPGEIPIPALEAFQISRYIYSELQGNAAQNKASQFLPTTVTKLPRDLVYDAEQKKVTIVASEIGCSIKIQTVSYKIIRSATLLSLTAPETCVRAVYAALPSGLDPEYFTFEIECLQKLGQVPGVVRLLSVVGKGAEAHMVLEAFDHTVMHMIRNKAAYTHVNRLQVAASLTQGLAGSHQQNILQNDLNENNAVVRKLPDSTVQAALIDFSLSCYPGKPGRANHFKRPGLYNAYWNTAPELIGRLVTDNLPTSESLYKAEVFALGCVLWHLFDDRGEYVPWAGLLEKYYETTLPEAWQNPRASEISLRRRNYVHDIRGLIEYFVEKKYKEIMVETVSACRTQEDKLRAAICSMLLSSPEQRTTAQQASYEFVTLLKEEQERNVAPAAGAASAAANSAAAPPANDCKSAVEKLQKV